MRSRRGSVRPSLALASDLISRALASDLKLKPRILDLGLQPLISDFVLWPRISHLASDLGLWPRISASALGSRALASNLELCYRISDSSLGSRIATCLVQASSHVGCPPSQRNGDHPATPPAMSWCVSLSPPYLLWLQRLTTCANPSGASHSATSTSHRCGPPRKASLASPNESPSPGTLPQLNNTMSNFCIKKTDGDPDCEKESGWSVAYSMSGPPI